MAYAHGTTSPEENEMRPQDTGRSRQQGQALALVVLAMVGLIAMVGLVVDGGNAWAQQRLTQNATDATAEAGAVVLVERLGGAPRTDANVLSAVNAAAAVNGINVPAAYYTDVYGTLLTGAGTTTNSTSNAARVGGGTIPNGGAGVQAHGSKDFDTYLARIVNVDRFTARTEATAVAGVLTGICPASQGCGVLPVTFPVVVSTCDNTNGLAPGSTDWPIVSESNANSTNEAIVPLCSSGPGAVGWLDLGDGNLDDQISTPSNRSFSIPTWVQTQPGNVNAVEDEMNGYSGEVILLPLFDGTCKVEPPDADLGSCPAGQEGVGNNTWYHVPKFTGFLLDRAYIAGNDHPECNQAPGGPPVGGNGSTGCLKGWFVKYITVGPVGPAGPDPNDPSALGVQLIR